MLKSIVLKEWLKIRRFWYVALALNLGLLAYLFIDMRHLFNTEHSEMIWYWAFELRRVLYAQLKYLPAFTGALLAAAQFGPEMLAGRFRLSLHLPLRGDLLVWSWIGFGLAMGGVLALMDMIGLYLVVGIWVPREAALSALLTSLPWMLGGFVAYLGASLVLLEPQHHRRLVYLALTGGFLALLYQERGYQEYDRAFLPLAALALLFVPAVILPAHRYRHQSG